MNLKCALLWLKWLESYNAIQWLKNNCGCVDYVNFPTVYYFIIWYTVDRSYMVEMWTASF